MTELRHETPDGRVFEVVPIGRAATDPDVVALCERLLVKAKSGQIRGLIGISTLVDGCTENYMEGKSELIVVLGQLARLSHVVQTNADLGMTSSDEPSEGG